MDGQADYRMRWRRYRRRRRKKVRPGIGERRKRRLFWREKGKKDKN